MNGLAAIPTLETPRLRLRPHRLEDFPAYAAMWADPNVIRYIGGVPFPREAAWSRFLRHAGMWHFLGFGGFVFEDKATGAFAGEGGFHDFRRALEPSLEGSMEAGWVLASAWHGRGLAEEAMRPALDWAAEHGTGPRLTCMIHTEHAASLHVAGKLGFAEFARSTYHGSPMVLLDRPRQAKA